MSRAQPNDMSAHARGSLVAFGRLPFACALICWLMSVGYMGDYICTYLVTSIWLYVSYLTVLAALLLFLASVWYSWRNVPSWALSLHHRKCCLHDTQMYLVNLCLLCQSICVILMFLLYYFIIDDLLARVAFFLLQINRESRNSYVRFPLRIKREWLGEHSTLCPCQLFTVKCA